LAKKWQMIRKRSFAFVSFTNMKRFFLLAILILCQANNDLHQITLMSYNVMLVPSVLIFERDQIARAHLLTKAKFLRTSDILCLQEVFQTKPSEILLDSLSETYPYSTPVLGKDEGEDEWNEIWNDHIRKDSLKFVSGGVTILSKWPIIYAAEYFYKDSCSAHTFVRTGFVYAKILYGKNKTSIHVFGTHLQPNDYRGCYVSGEDKIREKQMYELNDFIQSRNISQDELVFILGDFNINKYNIKQYEKMIEILNVYEQYLHSSSLSCSWDSSFNAMTNSRHGSQLLDYVFLHRNHSSNHSLWFNLITDRMASKQWHLLGRNHSFYNSRNIPLLELSDHYPVIGFFHQNKQQLSYKPSGVLTYVKFVTIDSNFPVMIIDREVRIGTSINETGSLFILTNNGTPRRHRCLRSEQYVLLIDGLKPEFYLSNEKLFRMKYGKEHVNRYLKILQIDNNSTCIKTNSTVIFQSRLATGYYYVKNQFSQLCSCTNDKNQAQVFRLIEVERRNISCTMSYEE
jgi:sphingomyelin phosphodiesterase